MIEDKISHIRSCLSEFHSRFDAYSPSSQEKLVAEVFKRSQHLTMDQTNTLIGSITLSPSCVNTSSPMNHPVGEAFASFLLTESDWYGKVPSFWKVVSFLPSVLWKKDLKLMREAKSWLQANISNVSKESLNGKLGSAYLRNLISYYPYFVPEQGEKISLPMGASRFNVTYTVELIELTPSYLGSPITAYGLVPERGKKAPPILLFKGTTYPADDGFYLSLLTDINPYGSVGMLAFQMGKEKIETWLQERTKECKAEVMGVSLGGCLSLQTASQYPEYIKAVHAFNSPGITFDEVDAWQQSRQEKPEVNVYLQDGDPVSSSVGRCFAPDWKIHGVFAPATDPIQAHASTYTAHPEAFIIPEDVKSINQDMRRRFWPIIQNCLLLPAFLIGALFLIVIAVYIFVLKAFKRKDPSP
jgi:pimeloyl-ACP methyl ester carboxylesterase